MRKWPERRDLGRGERSDSLASLKERGGRDGDGERQEGKSELQGNHDCEVCTTGGLWQDSFSSVDALYPATAAKI